jgi:hypothetical protein
VVGVPVGDFLRGTQDAVEVAEPAARPGLLAASPQGQLAHRDTDRQQQHQGLDVVRVGHGEGAVGLGEEQVEEHPAREGRDPAAHPVPGRRCRNDDKDQDQHAGSDTHLVPEQAQQRGEAQRDDGAGQDEPGSVTASSDVHASREAPRPGPEPGPDGILTPVSVEGCQRPGRTSPRCRAGSPTSLPATRSCRSTARYAARSLTTTSARASFR